MGFIWVTLCVSHSHIVSVIWVQNGKPMRAAHMGSVKDRCGVRGHGQEPNNMIWDPNHFSNMGPKWDTHVSGLYRPSVGSMWSKITRKLLLSKKIKNKKIYPTSLSQPHGVWSYNGRDFFDLESYFTLLISYSILFLSFLSQLLYFPVVCIFCADTVQFVLKDCITSRYCSD